MQVFIRNSTNRISYLNFLHQSSFLLSRTSLSLTFPDELWSTITRSRQILLVVRSNDRNYVRCCLGQQFNSRFCLESMLNDFHERWYIAVERAKPYKSCESCVIDVHFSMFRPSFNMERGRVARWNRERQKKKREDKKERKKDITEMQIRSFEQFKQFRALLCSWLRENKMSRGNIVW